MLGAASDARVGRGDVWPTPQVTAAAAAAGWASPLGSVHSHAALQRWLLTSSCLVRLPATRARALTRCRSAVASACWHANELLGCDLFPYCAGSRRLARADSRDRACVLPLA